MKINLGENEGLATPGNFIFEVIVGLIFTGIVVLLLVLYINQLESGLDILKNEIRELETKINQDVSLRQKRASYREKKSAIEDKNMAIGVLESQQIGPVFLFSEISDLVSNRIYFKSLIFKGLELEIEGNAIDNLVLAEFLTRLNDSPFIASIALESTKFVSEESIDMTSFKIKGQARLPSYE